MHPTRRVISGIVLAAGLAACASVPRSAATPGVQLGQLSVVSAAADGQTFAVTLLVRNTNDVPVSIRHVRFRARLASEGYLDGQTTDPFTVEPMSTARVRVEVKSDRVSSLSRLMAFVQGPENALPYELSGEIDVGGRPPRLLPFSGEGAVPLASPRSD